MTKINEPADFFLFRYQISVDVNNFQQDMVDRIMTVDDLKTKKTALFRNLLTQLPKLASDESLRFISNKVVGDSDQFLFQVQQQSKKKVEQEFEELNVKHQPSAWLAIDTREDCQVIAIQSRYQPSPKKIIDKISDVIQSAFEKRSLIFNAHTIKKPNGFWEYVSEHKTSIKSVSFKICPPNMPALSKVLGNRLNKFVESTSAASGEFTLNSPRMRTLELKEQNKELTGLVKYVEVGGGDFTFKQLGSQKIVRPKQIIEVVTAVPEETETLIDKEISHPKTSIFKKIRECFKL